MPIRITDSYLEIATANPFDLDCEKTLSFATGREIRTAIAAPSAIAERLDEFYRPENVIDSLLEGIGTDAEITQLEDEEDAEDLNVSAEEASQRPVVRLVDVILSEGIMSRASDIHIEPEDERITDDPKVRRPDITKARERLGWEPKVNLADGLAETIEYFRDKV